MGDSTNIGTSSSLPIQVQIPGYRLRYQSGGDSLGLWFNAEQTSLGRKVTLKVLKPKYEHHEKAREAFLAEMDRLAELDHTNLPRVIDTIREGTLALVVERVGVQSVGAWMQEEGHRSLPPGRAFSIALGVAQALCYLAAKGLAHKNINPSVIVVREGGSIRIVTFRNLITAKEQAALKGKLAQDARYVAPEQLAGPEPIGPKTPVYQIGALLFHFLAGRPPHSGDTAQEIAKAHLTQDFPSLKRYQPFIDKSILGFVAACTVKDPADRPDLERMIEALEMLVKGKDPGLEPPPPPAPARPTAPKPRRRRRGR